MGSEAVIIGYGILGFLSILFFAVLHLNKKNDNSIQDDINKQEDPVSIGLKIMFVGVFIFSMIGMAKGVTESYDNCAMVVANETTNLTTLDSTYTYEYYCETNDYNEDNNLYKLTFLMLYITIILFIIGVVWILFVFLKNQLAPYMKKFFGRKR